MKYLTTIIRYGYLFVEANSESEAMDIAEHQKTDTVEWEEDWDVTSVVQDDSEPDWRYISEKAFD